jgi:RHS repeat-associated protein
MVRYWYEGPGLGVTKRERGLNLDSGTKNIFRTHYSDDALHRLTEIKHERETTSVSTLKDLDYTWGDGSTGKLFQRSSYDTSGEGTSVEHDYLYDNLGRLVEDKHGVGGGSPVENDFTFSSVQFWNDWKKDNVTNPIYRVFSKPNPDDGSQQLGSYTNPSTTFSYDVCGNMTGPSPSVQTHFYDHENRLVYIDGATDYWFRYDALGRRIEEKQGTMVTLFWYDGFHIVEETDSSLGLNRLSLFGVKIDEVLYSGDVVSGSLTSHRWPMENHLGSVVMVKDDSSSTTAVLDYTAFGELTAQPAEAYPYTFTGRRVIGSLSLMDYRARLYEPGCGRFLQRDPLGVWGDGRALGAAYAYVRNWPTMLRDPTGRFPGAAISGCKCPDEDSCVMAKWIPPYFDLLDPFSFSPGHAWIEGTCVPNGSAGFYPEEWPDPEFIAVGGYIASPDGHEGQLGTGIMEAPLARRCSGRMEAGSATGKACECVTKDDIKSCIQALIDHWDENVSYCIPVGTTCMGFVADVTKRCCLQDQNEQAAQRRFGDDVKPLLGEWFPDEPVLAEAHPVQGREGR